MVYYKIKENLIYVERIEFEIKKYQFVEKNDFWYSSVDFGH